MSLNPNKHNEAIKSWGAAGLTVMQNTGRSMGIRHRENSQSKSDSLTKIKDRYFQDNTGFINRVTFGTINRSLIYTTYGAGKGFGGSKGSRWIDRFGNRKRTSTDSLNKLGTGRRSAKPFINAMLEGPDGVEKLADIVAEHQGDAIVENLFIK